MKNLIKAEAESIKSNWYVWFFPIIALGISGWLFFNYLQQRGPTIKISFEEGSSLQAEKTRVRFRGVDIGAVEKVMISEDNKDVIAYVALNKDAAHFAVEGSSFWIVSPKVSFQGITGLETLIEGTYIAATPGKEQNAEKKEFKGKMTNESMEALDDASVIYYLDSARADSLTVGNNLTFRGLKIGYIRKVELSKTAQLIHVQLIVEKKYARLIRTNTAFWNKLAVKANLGLFGSSLKIESLDTLLHGGIECFTPDQAGPMAKSQTTFQLLAEAPKNSEKWNPQLEF